MKSNRNIWIITISICIVILGGATGLVYWKITSGRVYTDTATITAPTDSLAPTSAGTLEALYVHEGDLVPANTPVAQVGNEVIKTKEESLIVTVNNQIGTIFNPGQAVVTAINPQNLRVDGQVQEDKGLNTVQVGDKTTFTVDGFPGTYQGIVDEVSPTSHAGDVVFNISDQRQVSTFDVKVRFNVDQYPELKNGMSAKLWIYTQ